MKPLVASALDRVVELQRLTTTVNEFGSPTETWSTVATLRAQRVESRTRDYLSGAGEGTEHVAVFRIRYRDDLATADRILAHGQAFEIVELVELGRRRGLELRTREVS